MRSLDAPVLSPPAGKEAAAELRKRLEPVLKLSESEMLALIPDRSGIYFVGCPNCAGGTQEGQISWTIERPHEVFCKHCGMRYPSEKFPHNKVLKVRNPVGVVQEYPCYEAPTPPPRRRPASAPQPDPGEGYRFFFQAKGWYLARAYFEDVARELATLYHWTGERSYARRAAVILNRFAEVYPGYCVHYDLPFIQKLVFSGDQKAPFPVEPYRAAKWDWWAYMDIPEDLIRAYDLIRASGEVDWPSRRRIENDLFRGSVAFVRAIPVLLTNMDPTLLKGLIVAGLVLREPDYIHQAVGWVERLIRGQFFVDGMWREGAISYHSQTVGGLSLLARLLKGYSDPDGYVHPEDGERYEDLDLVGRFPILGKARNIPDLMKYPNGRTVAFHDTWAREAKDPKPSTGPILLTGAGQARLGRGKGADQMEAHLHFSGGYGHQHADLLSMTLFSHGQERLADIGYTHTRNRCWTVCTLAHSTVMVDGKDQAYGNERNPTDGNLMLYVPGDETFQAVEAGGGRAYPGLVKTYRRLLVMVGGTEGEAYLVDVFRVSGGDRHDYVLVGDADHDGALETDLPTAPYGPNLLPPGVKVTYPTGESVQGDAEGHNLAYAFVRNVRKAAVSGAWSVSFTSAAEPKAVVRVHGAPEPGTELLLGEAPSIRRAREDDGKADDFVMPVLIARREGGDLSSVYASVLEPCVGEPFIRAVERLPVTEGGAEALALKVTRKGGTDYLLVAPEGGRVVAGGVTLEGRLGFVREGGQGSGRAVLVGGTHLSMGGRIINGTGTARGKVTGTLRRANGDRRDGLLVETEEALGKWVKGRTVIIRDEAGFSWGFEVKGVEEKAGRQVLALGDDPGIEVCEDGTARQVFFPNRALIGGLRFEIAGVASVPQVP